MSNKWFSHFPTSTPEASALRSARIDFELAKTRHHRNDFDGELDALRNSLSTLEEMSIESDDTDTVRTHLIAALVLVSDFAGAAEVRKTRLAYLRTRHGAESIAVADELYALAYDLARGAQLHATAPYMREAHEIYRKVLGDNDENSLFTLVELGIVLVAHGEGQEGANHIQEASRLVSALHNPPSRLVSLIDKGLSMVREQPADREGRR